jgi:predicted metal-binding protein
MGCAQGCNVAISGDGKMTYVLGRFDGTAADAEALADYAGKHAESESGTVPFRSWHPGVKGHFVARVPPLG